MPKPGPGCWMVVDHKDGIYAGWQAVLRLLWYSPLWWMLYYLFARTPLGRGGQRLYSWIASQRIWLDDFSDRWLPFRPVSTRLPVAVGSLLIALCVVFVVYWNLTTLRNFDLPFPEKARVAHWVLQLDQRWKLFAPHPNKRDRWWVMPGKLADGTELDVFHQTIGAPSFDKPEPHMYMKTNWRKYMAHLLSSKHRAEIRERFSRYLCMRWNRRTDLGVEKRLVSLQIYMVLDKTPPDYQPSQPKEVLVHETTCPSDD